MASQACDGQAVNSKRQRLGRKHRVTYIELTVRCDCRFSKEECERTPWAIAKRCAQKAQRGATLGKTTWDATVGPTWAAAHGPAQETVGKPTWDATRRSSRKKLTFVKKLLMVSHPNCREGYCTLVTLTLYFGYLLAGRELSLIIIQTKASGSRC